MRWLLSNKLKEERGRDTEDVVGRALQADGKINTRLLDKKMMYMCHCNKQRRGRDFGRKLRRHGRNCGGKVRGERCKYSTHILNSQKIKFLQLNKE